MIINRKLAGMQVTFWIWLLILASFSVAGQAQQRAVREVTFPALLVSDIHFDPFHDPCKVRQLAPAPVSKWSSLLSAADSGDQAEAFAKLQQSCQARGVDTPYVLLHSSLEAMWQRQKDAKFMMVSGDLMAHNFSCRYATLLPEAKAGEYEAFVLKTVSFVMES